MDAAAASRRKQPRPARIEEEEDEEDDVSEKSPPDTPRSHNGDGEEGAAEDDDRSESSPVEIRTAGMVLGPIKVRRLASPLDATRGAIATLVDASGNALFFEVDRDERLLTTVRPTASIDDANCVVMEEAPDQLRLMMTKSIAVTDTLIALYITASSSSASGADDDRESRSANGDSDGSVRSRQRAVSDADDVAMRQGTPKKYLCDQCHLVSFNSLDNLRAHQISYCSQKDNADSNTPAPPMTPRPASNSQVAFHGLQAALLAAAASSGLQPPRLVPPPMQLMNGLLLPPPSLLSTPVMPAPLPHAAPNVIYLPIGYHDIPAGPSGSIIQMLGQPQTIVPIAVPRPITGGAPLLPHLASCLTVHPAMCGTIRIPASLQMAVGDVVTTIPVRPISEPAQVMSAPHAQPEAAAPSLTPHALQMSQAQPPRPHPVPKTSGKRRQSAVVAARNAVSSPALDLTSTVLKRRRTHTENNESTSPAEANKHSSSSSASSSKCSPHRLTPQSPAVASPATPGSDSSALPPPPRPFPCECGIGFSTEATLKAHKTTYCKLTPRKNDENAAGKEPKRPPPKCGQCGYQPASASQLAVHMRNHHAEAFICNLCGYRGFSVRGIRSHLRTHPELDSVRFDDLLGQHVTRSAYVKGRVMPDELDDSPEAKEPVQTLIDA